MTLQDVIDAVKAHEEANEGLRFVAITVPAEVAGKTPPDSVVVTYGRPAVMVGDTLSARTVDGIEIPLA